ncbi:hypothetical protein [Pseudoalteromonas sp. NZS100]|uniref:hypothetical protein n=1 Tax=Pseudoalteromonas sp. NZS100 TaxID=2792046 RepID=UPI001E530800|nr:hypothetical protein [Pseudoalteromonas sp. NZS100]
MFLSKSNWKYTTALIIAAALTGCTSTVQLGKHSSKIEQVDIKNYTLDEEQTAYVGEQLIVRKSYKASFKKDTYQALNDFVFEGGILSTSVNFHGTAGDTYKISGKNELGNSVISIPGSIFMLGINNEGQWDQTVMSNSFWTSPVGSGDTYTMNPLDTTFKLVESQVPLSENGYINHEIVYTGQGTNGISLLYREYTFENMARSDFKQELVYPVDSKEIRFRNYLIDIISVSPSELKYRVIAE